MKPGKYSENEKYEKSSKIEETEGRKKAVVCLLEKSACLNVWRVEYSVIKDRSILDRLTDTLDIKDFHGKCDKALYCRYSS